MTEQYRGTWTMILLYAGMFCIVLQGLSRERDFVYCRNDIPEDPYDIMHHLHPVDTSSRHTIPTHDPWHGGAGMD